MDEPWGDYSEYAGTGKFQENKVYIATPDALALCIARSSAVMVLTIQYKPVLIFLEAGFQLPVPCYYWVMIKKWYYIFMFPNVNWQWLMDFALTTLVLIEDPWILQCAFDECFTLTLWKWCSIFMIIWCIVTKAFYALWCHSSVSDTSFEWNSTWMITGNMSSISGNVTQFTENECINVWNKSQAT